MDFFQAPQYGEILEQGRKTAANTVKTAVSDAANSVAGQIGIKNEHGANTQNSNQNQPQDQSLGPADEASVLNMNLKNDQTQDMVNDYYAPSSNQKPVPATEEEAQTQQQLAKLRKDLHDEEYYNPLFAFEHKKQERPAEVAEKEEEQKKMAALEQQKREEKDTPIALKRAQLSIENRDQGGLG